MFAIMLQASLWPGTKVGTGLANVPDLISRIVLSRGKCRQGFLSHYEPYQAVDSERTYQSDSNNRIKGAPDIILMGAR